MYIGSAIWCFKVMQSTFRRSFPSPGDSFLALMSIVRNHELINNAKHSLWLRKFSAGVQAALVVTQIVYKSVVTQIEDSA